MSANPASELVTTPRRRAWRRLGANRSAVLGGLIVLFFVILAVAAPLLAPHSPTASDWVAVRAAPSATYPFGTDDLGRDVLSRVIYGSRSSLLAGVVSVTIALVLGVPLGLLAGYFAGITDMIISRCTEALLACPFLILAIVFGAFLGPNLHNAMIAIGIAATPIFIRLTRGQTLAVKTEDHVEGARAVGASHLRILRRYILPNVLPPVMVQATLTIALAIIAEASLAFLGLGLQPPAPSWGSMLDTARHFLGQAPWMALFPGLAIFLAVFGFNLLGDGLRDALDPRDA
jgi:peptide/nickel transport system permease protein